MVHRVTKGQTGERDLVHLADSHQMAAVALSNILSSNKSRKNERISILSKEKFSLEGFPSYSQILLARIGLFAHFLASRMLELIIWFLSSMVENSIFPSRTIDEWL